MNKVFYRLMNFFNKWQPTIKEGDPLYTKHKIDGGAMIEALGGYDNILNFYPCSTRLRVQVKDPAQASPNRLKQLGAKAVITNEHELQLVYGQELLDANADLKAAMGEGKTEYTDTEKYQINSPLIGESISLKEVNDWVFSSGALGKGVGVIPTVGRLYAPSRCEVISLFPTGHALVIKQDDGVEMFIHLGLHTREVNSNYFMPRVREGEIVEAGDVLVDFDLQELLKKGVDMTSVILIANTYDYQAMSAVVDQHVDLDDLLISLKR